MTFDADEETKYFEKNRKSILSQASKDNEKYAMNSFKLACRNIYSEELEEIVPKIQKNPKSVYAFLRKYQEHELKKSSIRTKKVRISKGNYEEIPLTPMEQRRMRDVGQRTIKMRMTYVKDYFRKFDVIITEQGLKETLNKVPKRERDAITHTQVEKVVIHSEKIVKAMVMMQATSGMRMGEVLKLRVKDLERKARWKINIPAENTKTNEQRFTYITEECAEFVEPYLENKKPEDRVFEISRSGYTNHLLKAVKRAGIFKKNEWSGQSTIASHGFRSFFISQLGKAEGFFGHKMSGHSWANKEYDRYPEEEILEVYIDHEDRLKIFNRGNPDYLKTVREFKEKIKRMEERIETLKEEGNATFEDVPHRDDLKVN